MAEGFPIQTNFTAGEVSPYLRGRTDVNRYFNGAEILENFVVKPQGGIIRRSGTRFIAEVGDSSKLTVLHKFEFSTNEAYVIEFGEEYIRFYKNGVQIYEPGPVLGVPLEVDTTYQEEHLRGLAFTQSADVLYITHPSYPPKTLSRLSNTDWVFETFVTLDGPYLSTYGTASLNLTNVIRTADATASAPVFGTTPVYNITAIVGNGGSPNLKRLTVTAHTFLTGDSCSIRNVQEYVGGVPIEQTPYTNFGNINSTYIVTKIDANHVDLQGTTFYASTTFDLTAPATIRKNTNFGDYIEYRVKDTWRLAKIKQNVSTTLAVVDVVTNIKLDMPDSTFTSFSGGQLTSSHSGVFTFNDVGSFVKPRGTTWYKITGFVSDSVVTATAVTLTVYSYPTVLITVGETTTTGVVTADANTFVSTDVGRHIRLNFFGTQTWGKIQAVISATVVNVLFYEDVPLDKSNTTNVLISNNGVPTTWKLGAWSDATGYPSVVAFHGGRLVFASTPVESQTLWFSKSGDYPNFEPTDMKSIVSDDSAITVTIASGEVNGVIWMKSGPVLLLGTLGGEWQIKASTVNETITPTNIIATQQTPYGSCAVQAERVGSSVLFVQRSGTKVREMVYNFQTDQYEAKDLTVVSEHIIRTKGKAVAAAYQKEPNSLYWVVTNEGNLCCLTFEKEQEVVAWHNHPIGGNGFVEAVACIPSGNGYDVTYLIVKRTIDGETVRYVEYIESEFWPDSTTDTQDMFFVDCGSTYDAFHTVGVPVTQITNLDHLEGMTVSIVADGSMRLSKVVTGGIVQISGKPAVHMIHVGLPYVSKLKTMPIESGSDSGTAQGKTKRLHKLVIRFLNTIGCKFGESLTALENVQFRAPTDNMDEPPPIFSGDKDRSYAGSYNPYATLYITQENPYPMTILCVMPHMVTNK